MNPRKASDFSALVVPVLDAVGIVQPTVFAAAAAVPLTGSWLMPLARLLARAGSTTCWHASCLSTTGAPVESVTPSIGVGGHHVPPEASVAPTLESSSGFTGVTPRVKEASWPLRNVSATDVD